MMTSAMQTDTFLIENFVIHSHYPYITFHLKSVKRKFFEIKGISVQYGRSLLKAIE